MPTPEKISEVTAENAELDRLDEALFNRVGGSGLRTRRTQLQYLGGPINREWAFQLKMTDNEPSGGDDDHGTLTALNFTLQKGECIEGVLSIVVFSGNNNSFLFSPAWATDSGGSIDGWVEDAMSGARTQWNATITGHCVSSQDIRWMLKFYAENNGAGAADVSFSFGSASETMHVESGSQLTAWYTYRPLPD